jgi:hypothetical protein
LVSAGSMVLTVTPCDASGPVQACMSPLRATFQREVADQILEIETTS